MWPQAHLPCWNTTLSSSTKRDHHARGLPVTAPVQQPEHYCHHGQCLWSISNQSDQPPKDLQDCQKQTPTTYKTWQSNFIKMPIELSGSILTTTNSITQPYISQKSTAKWLCARVTTTNSEATTWPQQQQVIEPAPQDQAPAQQEVPQVEVPQAPAEQVPPQQKIAGSYGVYERKRMSITKNCITGWRKNVDRSREKPRQSSPISLQAVFHQEQRALDIKVTTINLVFLAAFFTQMQYSIADTKPPILIDSEFTQPHKLQFQEAFNQTPCTFQERSVHPNLWKIHNKCHNYCYWIFKISQ